MTRAARSLTTAMGVACIVCSWPLLTRGHLFSGVAALLGGFALAQLRFGWRAAASPLSATLVAPLVFLLLTYASDQRPIPRDLIPLYYAAGVPVAFAAVAILGLPMIALMSLWRRPGRASIVAIGMISGVLTFAAIPILIGKAEALLSVEQLTFLVIAGLTGAASGLVFTCIAGIGSDDRSPATTSK